jgi:hypothetical protein
MSADQQRSSREFRGANFANDANQHLNKIRAVRVIRGWLCSFGAFISVRPRARLQRESGAGQENTEYRPAMTRFGAAADAEHAMVLLHGGLD